MSYKEQQSMSDNRDDVGNNSAAKAVVESHDDKHTTKDNNMPSSIESNMKSPSGKTSVQTTMSSFTNPKGSKSSGGSELNKEGDLNSDSGDRANDNGVDDTNEDCKEDEKVSSTKSGCGGNESSDDDEDSEADSDGGADSKGKEKKEKVIIVDESDNSSYASNDKDSSNWEFVRSMIGVTDDINALFSLEKHVAFRYSSGLTEGKRQYIFTPQFPEVTLVSPKNWNPKIHQFFEKNEVIGKNGLIQAKRLRRFVSSMLREWSQDNTSRLLLGTMRANFWGLVTEQEDNLRRFVQNPGHKDQMGTQFTNYECFDENGSRVWKLKHDQLNFIYDVMKDMIFSYRIKHDGRPRYVLECVIQQEYPNLSPINIFKAFATMTEFVKDRMYKTESVVAPAYECLPYDFKKKHNTGLLERHKDKVWMKYYDYVVGWPDGKIDELKERDKQLNTSGSPDRRGQGRKTSSSTSRAKENGPASGSKKDKRKSHNNSDGSAKKVKPNEDSAGVGGVDGSKGKEGTVKKALTAEDIVVPRIGSIQDLKTVVETLVDHTLKVSGVISAFADEVLATEMKKKKKKKEKKNRQEEV